MRPIEARLIPEGALALLTALEVTETSEVQMADFRDSLVLCHRPSGALLGVSRGSGVRLCSRPPFMRDGVWCGLPDAAAQQAFPSLKLGPSDVVLVPVE